MADTAMTVAQVFETMASRFNPRAATGIDITLQFELSGEGGGTYHVKVAGGACEIGKGPAARPNLTIRMPAADYLDMISGRLEPTVAIISEKLKIEGDLRLARRMQELFPNF